MKSLKFVVILAVVFFGGCSKAEISFVSNADMKPAIKGATDLKWSIVLTKDNIIQVITEQDVGYNITQTPKSELNKHILFDWVRPDEEKTVKISPGVYDWLIVLDHNGDGKIDSFHGTLTSQVKLSRHEFLGGMHYKITVKPDESVEMRVR